jgi:hypothetical protein
MSADMNIDQGDNSRSPTTDADFSGLLSLGSVASAAGCGADGTIAAGAGATCSGAAAGCDGAGACWAAGAGFCCADTGDASDSIASAEMTAQAARRGEIFIIRSSAESDF